MIRKEVMFMSSVCAGGQKERAPSRKGLFAESDPELCVRRQVLRAQMNPLLESERVFLAKLTDVCTTASA